jgi:hypothetical protein
VTVSRGGGTRGAATLDPQRWDREAP